MKNFPLLCIAIGLITKGVLTLKPDLAKEKVTAIYCIIAGILGIVYVILTVMGITF